MNRFASIDLRAPGSAAMSLAGAMFTIMTIMMTTPMRGASG